MWQWTSVKVDECKAHASVSTATAAGCAYVSVTARGLLVLAGRTPGGRNSHTPGTVRFNTSTLCVVTGVWVW